MTDNPEMPDAPGSPVRRARALLFLGIGYLLLIFQLLALELYLEQGLHEFAYSPFCPDEFPFGPMRGFTFEQLMEHVIRLLAGLPGLLLLTVGASQLVSLSPPGPEAMGRLTVAAAGLCLILITVLVVLVLRDRPMMDDELTYSYQAGLLARGMLGDPGLPFIVPELFTVEGRAGFTGKYLFGEPLAQVPGWYLGVPALSHVPIAALTIWWLHKLAERVLDREHARWAAILLCCSPMFLLTTPTAQSQATSLCCVVGAGLGYVCCTSDRPLRGAALLAGCVGFGLAVRPQALLPVGIVLGPAALYHLIRARKVAAVLVLLAVTGLFGAVILGYNQLITGNPLKLPWYLVEPVERYGFGRIWENDVFEHGLVTMLQNLGATLVRFNAWWLGWPCSLVLIWAWFRLGRPRIGGAIWGAVALAIVAFEAAYYSTGVSDTGPIYHYELLLPASLLGAAVVVQALRRWPRLVWMGLAIHIGLGTVLFTQHHWRRLGRLTGYIHRDAEQMLAKIPGRALLFYESDCSETLTVGWIHSPFPKRYRDDRDRVVTYPRPPLSQLRAYLERYRDRDCWYLRRAQEEGGRYQLWPCSHAARFFNRAVFFQEASCLGHRSTAEQMGMYKPVEANKLRREKWRSEAKGTKRYRDFRRKYQQMEKRTPGLFLPPSLPQGRSSLSKEQ